MPPQAADLEEALKKKGGLTLSQLANYDDIITDALVDRVCACQVPFFMLTTNTVLVGLLLVVDPETQAKLPSMSRSPRGRHLQDPPTICNY